MGTGDRAAGRRALGRYARAMGGTRASARHARAARTGGAALSALASVAQANGAAVVVAGFDLGTLAGRPLEEAITTIVDQFCPPGILDEDVIRLISAKKNEPAFMLDWRLKAYRRWTRMTEPAWAHVRYPPIDFQAISYYSAPRQKTDGPKSLADVDPKLLETYDKLGIPLHERARLAGVAVDAVFDTISGALGNGDSVAIAGFGTFEVRERAARTGRNPRTGEEIQIPAAKNPAFKAGKALKEAVN